MQVLENGGALYLSASELKRLGMKRKQIAMLGAPDKTYANPYGYPGKMAGYAWERAMLLLPDDVMRCACGYVGRGRCAECAAPLERPKPNAGEASAMELLLDSRVLHGSPPWFPPNPFNDLPTVTTL